jgi:hypothetical protein
MAVIREIQGRMVLFYSLFSGYTSINSLNYGVVGYSRTIETMACMAIFFLVLSDLASECKIQAGCCRLQNWAEAAAAI